MKRNVGSGIVHWVVKAKKAHRVAVLRHSEWSLLAGRGKESNRWQMPVDAPQSDLPCTIYGSSSVSEDRQALKNARKQAEDRQEATKVRLTVRSSHQDFFARSIAARALGGACGSGQWAMGRTLACGQRSTGHACH